MSEDERKEMVMNIVWGLAATIIVTALCITVYLIVTKHEEQSTLRARYRPTLDSLCAEFTKSTDRESPPGVRVLVCKTDR